MLRRAIIICLLFLFGATTGRLETKNDLYDLTVVHVNDFHARFEETNDAGGTCKYEGCIGGFSRLYSEINDILTQLPDHILLNAGDNFQGTLWYNIFKWNVTQYFLNKLPFDAISVISSVYVVLLFKVLGNHEFDDGIKGVVPFIKNLEAPVVVSNMDDSLEPDIQNTTENLKFLDESESVNAEAERLVREENVFTNIILSHCGYDVEQEIARKVTAASKISLVVGGHSHTFLYTGEPAPGPGIPAGPYPTIVNTTDGRQVLVVQASSYCRYLGNITVSYDNSGNVVGWSGEPIFLDTTLPQDEEINKELQPWKDVIDELGNRVIGKTLVTLDQTMCRYSECLLGNFVADAMVYSYTSLAEGSSWTYASLAVYNTGGLRTTIESGDITYNDMMTAQPFGNTFDVGEIEGKYIKEMFEFSMTPYNYQRAYADINMLQSSGFHVICNLTQPIGSRVQSIKVRCNECLIPIYEDLDLDKTYRLIIPSFLGMGGDGFTVISENIKNVEGGRLDIDVYVEYLEAKSPIIEEIEGRIVFVDEAQIEHRNVFMCKDENCIGGFSRLYATIMNMLKNKPNAILLNAGDNFEGTLWYNIHKWNVTQYFFNRLPIDAFTLGNHEFDDKIEGLVPFLQHLKSPVIVSNIDASKEPSVQGLFNKSVVIERNGRKIGIIGDIGFDVGNLILLNESDSVNAEAERLVREEGVFTNVVLSHCGYDVDQEIAKKATSKISLIVGGHSHTFLYTGEPVPGPDIPMGPYPTTVQNKEGKTILVVQASSYTKYLGNITVLYDNDGNIVKWSGAPVFLDTKLPQDEEINKELVPWKEEVDRKGQKIVGHTIVRLEQSSCPMAECLIGNFITDAMVFGYTKSPEPGTWTDGSIALMHAGGLRSGIDIGNITYNDLVLVQPFENTIDLGEIEGRHLKEIFESSATGGNINLLQVSGVKVIYNLTMAEGSRVTSLRLRCRECDVPVYEELNEAKIYRIILPSFLARGSFGFTQFKKYLKNRRIGELDINLYVDYVEHRSSIFQEIQGRIQINT
ncbi:uncharacterized protein BDFB_009824 [Asbolus verrucosus]|uniref:apyrase n=1 Tax=Asbolus verrucosus TaxID=1661398 RepID=A0A482W540_ASBVE|nr:uncharacterized protein BDFB_009824 [Asbolus verrucosus]